MQSIYTDSIHAPIPIHPAIFGAGAQTATYTDSHHHSLPAGLSTPPNRSRRPSHVITTSLNTSTHTDMGSHDGNGNTSHSRMPRLTLLTSPTSRASTPGTPTRGNSASLNAVLPRLNQANTIRGMPIPTSPLLVKSSTKDSQQGKPLRSINPHRSPLLCDVYCIHDFSLTSFSYFTD